MINLKECTKWCKNLKSKVDKLDSRKLETNLVDLISISDIVKHNVVKKTDNDKFVKKVNSIKTNDTRDLAKKANYNTKNSDTEKKID